MEPKQPRSRRKLPTETPDVVPDETVQMLKIAEMLERLAAEIKRLLPPQPPHRP